jgi:hypothetical protein
MGLRRVACRLSAVFTVDVGRGRWSDGNFVCVLLHLQLSVKNVTAWLTFAFPSKNRSKSGKGFLCIRNCQFEVTHNVHWRTCSSCPSRRRWGAKINSTRVYFSLLSFTTWNQIKLKCESERTHRSASPLHVYNGGNNCMLSHMTLSMYLYDPRLKLSPRVSLYAAHWPICPNCRQEGKVGMCLRAA